jgi:hypothetical protein
MMSADAGFSIPVGPPSEAEKADAIEILRVAPEWIENLPDEGVFPSSHEATKALIAEAERIWLEASVVNERGVDVGQG